ncbi:Protein DDI1 like protein, partial [Dictyocoela muelleri]
NENIEALIDSGSTKNYMNKEIANKINAELIEDREINLVFGNNTETKIRKSCTIETKIKGLINTKFIKYYVLDECPANLILGNDFLNNNDTMINYKNKCIIIDDEMVSFISDIEQRDETEEIMFD